MERRRTLLSSWPSLLPFLHGWWEVASVSAEVVTFELFQTLLQENGFAELLDSDIRVPLLELLDEFLKHYDCASIDISDELVAYWNGQVGVQFRCQDFWNCACSEPDDWDVQSRPVEFARYGAGQEVVVYWRELSTRRDSTLRAVVRKVGRRVVELALPAKVRSVSGSGRPLESDRSRKRQVEGSASY